MLVFWRMSGITVFVILGYNWERLYIYIYNIHIYETWSFSGSLNNVGFSQNFCLVIFAIPQAMANGSLIKHGLYKLFKKSLIANHYLLVVIVMPLNVKALILCLPFPWSFCRSWSTSVKYSILFFDNFIHESCIYISFYSSFSSSNYSHTLPLFRSMTFSLFNIIVTTHTHTDTQAHTYVHKYSLPSPFSIAHMRLCLGLTSSE